MLGRSAGGVLWMARYLERAENTARLLDAGFRMALTRGEGAASAEWSSVLVTMGLDPDYTKAGGAYTGTEVTNFVLRAPENDESVLAMIENARTNARMVRTALTREVWEATNESWMLLKYALARPIGPADLGGVLELIRRQAKLVRGAMEGTMLRNDIYNFARLGTHLERADNVARIIDVKYHILLPSLEYVGSQLDTVQWELVLRSVSGERAFHWLNAGAMDPRGIAEFLILDRRFPRSLAYCYRQIAGNIHWMGRDYGATPPSHQLLEAAHERLTQTTMAEISKFGLHEYIAAFLVSNRAIANAIAADYRFYA